jgi:hypothetical protein
VLLTGSLLPSILLSDTAFHQAMLWFVVPTSAVALSIGCRRHKDSLTLLVGGAGLLGVVLAATALHGLLGEVGEKVVTVFAAGALAGGHVRNFRLCREADCLHTSDAP